MRKANIGGAQGGISANSEGQPVPRSRNKEGVPNPGNAGGANVKKGTGAAGGTGTPVPGATPAVGGAQQTNAAGTNQTQSSLNDNDTFNKHYNKELRVSKDEIPIVLAELNDSAYRFIKREQYERALNLLQKAYGIMDVIDFKSCRRDKFHLFVMFHNMALCYQKMQMLEECASCIDQALDNLTMDNLNLEERSISNRMRKLVIITRLKMQFCAILSQIHRHKDALEQAREGVRLGHLLINDLRELCLFFIRREDISVAGNISNFYSVDNLAAGAYDQPPKDDNAQGFSTNNSIAAKNKIGAQRNRSFSSFLSQQEAYGAYESMNAGLNDKGANNVSAISRGQSSHNLSSFYSANQLDSSMSYIEKTARKLFPILNELKKRMVPEKKRISSSANQVNRKRDGQSQPKKYGNASVLTLDAQDDEIESDAGDEQLFIDLSSERNGGLNGKQGTDMKNILGYLNQGEWTSKLSIGSIMQLQPFKIKDLIEQGQNELELTRESFIQKVSGLCVSYFCYSTEIRFIIQMKEDLTFDTPFKQRESEFWHAKSLELACTFLPGECPLLNHINLSYQKHFAPVKTTIMEDQQQEDDLMVIKPLNGVDNTKVQPIIRRLSNVQVCITPFQLTPINAVTKQVLNQMISFNEYQENGNNPDSQGAIGQNILPASLLRPNSNNPGHNQSVGNIPCVGTSGGLDQVKNQAKQHSMSVHQNIGPGNSGQRGDNSSLTEIDQFFNEFQQQNPSSFKDDKGRQQRISSGGGQPQQTSSSDDIGKLDILLKKLIDSKKITKKQLIQKLMSVSDGNDGGFPQEESLTENILDAESEDGSSRVPRDASHRNQISNTNSNFYKLEDVQEQQMQNDRPKSSKGGLRSSMQNKVTNNQAIHQRSNANIKPPHLGMKSMDRIEQQDKHDSINGQLGMQQPSFSSNTHGRQGKKVESSASHNMNVQSQENSKISGAKTHSGKTKKDVRPLSGGIPQKQQFSKQSESRSRMQHQQHNMSMFEKIGGPSNKNQQSPPGPGPIDFHGKQVPGGHHLKPVGTSKIQHNQSFDTIPVHNQLVSSHAGQHGSQKIRGDQNKIHTSGHNSIKGSHVPHHSSTHTALQGATPQVHQQQQVAQIPSSAQNPNANPQAYDELKKRLLNEYKKLVNNKKGVSTQGGSSSVNHADTQERDHGRNIAGMHSKSGGGRDRDIASGKTGGVKKHSNRVHPGASSSIQNQPIIDHANGVNGLSQQHLNMIQNQSNQALIDSTLGPNTGSPKAAPHLNVYKPTFIINNSFQNEQQIQEELLQSNAANGGRGLGTNSAAELSKKYSRQSAKQANSSGTQVGPSSSSTQQMMAVSAQVHSSHPGHVSSANSSGMHHGKPGTSANSSYVQQQNISSSSGIPGQSRLKKNSAIDRSSSQSTGTTSGKLGQSKTASKIHANESSMHSGSSKLMQPSRDISQKYMTDKSQSSQALQMSKHSSQSHQFNGQYLAGNQHHHQSQIQTTGAGAQEMSRGGGPSSSSLQDQGVFSHNSKSTAGYVSHQIIKQTSATNGPSISSVSKSNNLQPRRQNVSAGGASMGPLGHHSSSLNMHPQSSHGTRAGAYDKLKKKMGSRQ